MHMHFSRARKHGQFSLEFFLVLTFFALMLFWFNNYYSQLRSQDLLFAQQDNLLKQMVLLEGEAHSANQTLHFAMPCLVSEGKGVPYWVYGGSVSEQGVPTAGTNETTLQAVVYAARRQVKTVFPVTASPNPLLFECDSASSTAGEIIFNSAQINGVWGVSLVKG